MADEKIKFDEVKCSVELFNKVIGVLQKIPYNQVATLMDEIKVGFFAMPLAPEIVQEAEDSNEACTGE